MPPTLAHVRSGTASRPARRLVSKEAIPVDGTCLSTLCRARRRTRSFFVVPLQTNLPYVPRQQKQWPGITGISWTLCSKNKEAGYDSIVVFIVLRGAILNRTYGTGKNLYISLFIFTDNIWSYLLWSPVIALLGQTISDWPRSLAQHRRDTISTTPYNSRYTY